VEPLQVRDGAGLLIVAGTGAGFSGPATRRLGLAALDPIVTLPGGASVRLATHEWADGTIAPRGHELLAGFELVDGLPRWRWRIGDVVLEREIAMTRVFDAPRHLVFDAWTKPELLKRWLLGPPGWSMVVCEIDLRVGGSYRYVWRHERGGKDMGMGGEYREAVPPERLVATERFDDPWYRGEAVGTMTFVEEGGRTTLTQTLLYETREARDGVLESGMERGVEASYDRLAEYLASVV
jgi:uncharacterized protein YndB with AHSA1/START domain